MKLVSDYMTDIVEYGTSRYAPSELSSVYQSLLNICIIDVKELRQVPALLSTRLYIWIANVAKSQCTP